MRRVSSRLVLFAVLAVSALGFAAVGAVAHVTPPKGKVVTVTGGTTTIKASTATAVFLAKHGITATAIAPATLNGASLTLPVKGGLVTAKKLVGVVVQRGAVKFATAKKSIVIAKIKILKVGKVAHVVATVGKRVLPLGTITGLKTAAGAKTATLSGELRLSKAVAAVLNKLAGKHVASAGYDFGSFTTSLTLK